MVVQRICGQYIWRDLKCGVEYMECDVMKWDARCGVMHNVADISGAIWYGIAKWNSVLREVPCVLNVWYGEVE